MSIEVQSTSIGSQRKLSLSLRVNISTKCFYWLSETRLRQFLRVNGKGMEELSSVKIVRVSIEREYAPAFL